MSPNGAGTVIRSAALAGAFALALLFAPAPASAQGEDGAETDDAGARLAAQRIGDAEVFLADRNWDAALFALEDAGFYVTEGPQLATIKSLTKQAKFGKYKADGDANEARGDLEAAVRAWKKALRQQRDTTLKDKVARIEDELSPPEPTTPEEVTPEEVTPEEITPEEITPEEITPEEITPAEDVSPGEITAGDEVTPDEPTPGEVATPEETTPAEPVTGTGPTGDGDASLAHGAGETSSGDSGGEGGSFPWIWLVGLAVLVGLGVVGTRPPVLAAVAGGMTRIGWNGAALSLYERLVAGSEDNIPLRLAHVRCLAALGKTDAEARTVYKGVLDDDPPTDLLLHLASLYWEHGFVDGEAPYLYELATGADGGDPDLLEALEACLDEGDDERRLDVARRLLEMGRPSAERLLRVAEQIGSGEPDGETRALIQRVATLDTDDEALIERRGVLLERLVPVYQEYELDGDDSVALREALLLSVGRQQAVNGGYRMAGTRAVRARALLAELARMLRRAGQPERLFDLYVTLLERFDGDASLLDGLLRTAGELGNYTRALDVVGQRYPLEGRGTDPALAVRVATEFMLAGSRHLRERAHESGAVSADLPSLTFFERARAYLASVTVQQVFRPDVREQLKLFLDLYMQADDHLLALDAAVARLLWGVGEYPAAVALFHWSCGFEPHIVDKGLMLLPSDSPPPCEEFFPEERSTLVAVVADRPVTDDDVDELSARARRGAFNGRLTLLVAGHPVSAEVRRRAGTRRVPVITMGWDELTASLEGGYPRQTFGRFVRSAMQYAVPPGARADDLEDARIFGRDALAEELGERFSRGATERILVLSGLRGVGKSTLWRSSVRSDPRLPAAILRPTSDPDIYTPGLWLAMLEDLFASARSVGLVGAPTHTPRLTPEPAPLEAAGVFRERFERLLGAMDGAPDARFALAVDPVDGLFPIPDPVDPDPEKGEGAQNLLGALTELAGTGNVSVTLISRQVGASGSRSLGGVEAQLPEGCDEHVVGLLEDDACHAMLSVLTEDLNVGLPDDVRFRLAEACGGHPQLCWMVVDAISAHRSQFEGMLDPETNDRVLEQVLDCAQFGEFAHHLLADFTWRERTVLGALAGSASPDGTVPLATIEAACEVDGEPLDVESLLDGLARTTLVALAPPDGYALRLGLLRDWLATRRR